MLRDDKTYPYIELTNEQYPRLLVVRDHLRRKNSRLLVRIQMLMLQEKLLIC